MLKTSTSHTRRAVPISAKYPSKIQYVSLAMSFLSVGALSNDAHADPPIALDRTSIAVGDFYSAPSVQFGINTSAGYVQTPSYDTGHASFPRLKADLLIGDSQGLSLDYYRYDKSYSTALSGSATIDGQAVSGSAALNADLRLDVGQLAYKWWLGKGNDVFGLGLGAAYYQARLSGAVSGAVAGMSSSGSNEISESTEAPLIELGWRHAFSPNVRVYAEASGIKRNGGSITGHIYTGTVGMEWFPYKNIGLAADYGISKINLNRNGDPTASMNVRLAGPSAYFKLRF